MLETHRPTILTPARAGFAAQPPAPLPQPCPICAAALSVGAQFCPSCGRRLVEKGPLPTEVPEDLIPKGPCNPPQGGEVPSEPDGPVAPVQPSPTPPLNPAPPQPQGATATCPCGRDLTPDMKFCPQCGGRIGTAQKKQRLARRGNGKSDAAVELGDRGLTVGKAPDCDLAVSDDDYLSRRHARLYRSDGLVYLEDLDSANGTFLRIHRPIVLEPGDEILVGTSVLRFEES
jgi:hypothetical protein